MPIRSYQAARCSAWRASNVNSMETFSVRTGSSDPAHRRVVQSMPPFGAVQPQILWTRDLVSACSGDKQGNACRDYRRSLAPVAPAGKLRRPVLACSRASQDVFLLPPPRTGTPWSARCLLGSRVPQALRAGGLAGASLLTPAAAAEAAAAATALAPVAAAVPTEARRQLCRHKRRRRWPATPTPMPTPTRL